MIITEIPLHTLYGSINHGVPQFSNFLFAMLYFKQMNCELFSEIKKGNPDTKTVFLTLKNFLSPPTKRRIRTNKGDEKSVSLRRMKNYLEQRTSRSWSTEVPGEKKVKNFRTRVIIYYNITTMLSATRKTSATYFLSRRENFVILYLH